jgi:hypothetical protein
VANPIQIEVAIYELSRVIEGQRPPSVEARELARSVVSLVKDRGPRVCIVLASEFDKLRIKLQ